MTKKTVYLLFLLAILFFFLGIDGLGLINKIIEGKSYRSTQNTYIVAVWPNSPAEKSGLLYGDKVILINQMSVEGFYDQIDTIPLDELTLTVERDGQRKVVMFETGNYTHEAGGTLGATVSNKFLVPTGAFTILVDHLTTVIIPPKNNGPQFGQLFVNYLARVGYLAISAVFLVLGLFFRRKIRRST